MDEDIVGSIIAIILILVIVSGVCAAWIVNTKIEAEKEIRIKAIEVYGEDYIEENK